MSVQHQPNYQRPRLEPTYELWTLNDEGGWNKEPLDKCHEDAVEAFKHHRRVMPNCPVKLMIIREVCGS